MSLKGLKMLLKVNHYSSVCWLWYTKNEATKAKINSLCEEHSLEGLAGKSTVIHQDRVQNKKGMLRKESNKGLSCWAGGQTPRMLCSWAFEKMGWGGGVWEQDSD